MKLPTLPTPSVVDHLNTTYFHQVWNAPNNSERSNIQLYKAAERLQTGMVPVGQSVVGLPTTDAVYAVYKAGYRLFNRFTSLPEDRWVTVADYFTPHGTSLAIYSVDGRTCPSSQMFLLYLPMRNQVLVAIPQKYTKACTGVSYPDMFMTAYTDTTKHTPIKSSLYTAGSVLIGATPVPTIMTAIAQAKSECPLGTTVLVNGWVYHPDHVPTIVAGDVVQIVSDPDVVGYVEVTVDDNETGYYSDKYGEYRELLHIPKSINPNNVILTTDSLTAVVYDPSNHKGVLGHRINPHALESVTHNDFSMGRTALQGFSQSLNASQVKVRLYVRIPLTQNLLNEDVNHISDLYSLSDAEILKQLLGLSQHQIPEWKAENLEASGFISLLYRFSGFGSDNAISQFVDAMGYYDVASVLGQQMRFYTYQGAQVLITKPARLFGYGCQAIVYADGKKVPEGLYTISNYTSKHFLLGFSAASGVTPGTRIGLYILEEGYRTPVPFSPTEQSPKITLDNEDYTLFKITTYTDPQPVWNGTTYKGYKRIPLGTADYTVTTESDGRVSFEARMKHYGSHFYLVPKYGLATAVYDLDAKVDAKNPIILPLTTKDTLLETVPMMGYSSMEVYLNRYRLIEGVDYECKTVESDDNEVLQLLLTVSNYDYLDLEGGSNLLEVSIHGDMVASQDKGYAIENLLHRSAVPMIWTRSSSRVFVRGELQETITESGNIAITGDDVENGAPFLMEHNVAFGAGKLLTDISPNLDINLRSRIEHVLGIVPPNYPDTVLINHLHALYSPFLASIVTDVGNGVIKIADEPRDDAFIRQFKSYSLIFERDPTVGPNNQLIDRRFVTLAAHYANFAVQDPQQMIRVQRLVNLVLTPSELSIEAVLL